MNGLMHLQTRGDTWYVEDRISDYDILVPATNCCTYSTKYTGKKEMKQCIEHWENAIQYFTLTLSLPLKIMEYMHYVCMTYYLFK